MAERTILFCREVPWDTRLPVSTRKLAEEFARDGWRTVWLTPPLAPWHLRRASEAELVRQYRAGGVRTPEGVVAYTPLTLLPHSLRVPRGDALFAHASWRACRPALEDVLRAHGIDRVDVLWLSNLRGLGLTRLFPRVPVVWQVTDDYVSLSTTPTRADRLCRTSFRTADRLVFSSPLLAEHSLRRYGLEGRPWHLLPHGVDAWRLAAAAGGDDPLAGVPRPRVVYVGNTARADTALLRALAETGEASVVVIGESRPLADGAPPRLVLLGPRSPEEVGRLLPWCDVGLVSYGPRDLEAARFGNPMKTYEFAAAGLPVVGPPLAIFEALGVPVRPYTDLGSLRRAIAGVLAEGPEPRAHMRAWAERNTWAQRYREAAEIVESALEDRR